VVARGDVGHNTRRPGAWASSHGCWMRESASVDAEQAEARPLPADKCVTALSKKVPLACVVLTLACFLIVHSFVRPNRVAALLRHPPRLQ
jgi:hypothetical protein